MHINYSTYTSIIAHTHQLHFRSSPLQSTGKHVFMPPEFLRRPLGNTREEICLDVHHPDTTLGAALPSYRTSISKVGHRGVGAFPLNACPEGVQ